MGFSKKESLPPPADRCCKGAAASLGGAGSEPTNRNEERQAQPLPSSGRRSCSRVTGCGRCFSSRYDEAAEVRGNGLRPGAMD